MIKSKEQFYCYGCCTYKSVSLRAPRQGSLAQCSACQMPKAKKAALGIRGPYEKPRETK